MATRREFLKQALSGTAMLAMGGMMQGLSAKSYRNVAGANDRIRAGVAGVNSRGMALAENFSKQPNCIVDALCDVDSRALEKCMRAVLDIREGSVICESDYRKMLENKDLDLIILATPDHWHAPGALMALQAGKHVYLEKPCSHSPQEGEILIQAAAKYGKQLQMGNQRRSWPNVIEGVNAVRNGLIGKVYFGKSWYTNKRPSIGRGNIVDVPAWLNWELWQGPAPRENYRDNIVHYNWHWFYNWGTGEALNNGTHMIDILRWGMDVDYPTKVSSTGGRYVYDDDWQFPDTQVINLEFADGKAMTWEGRCCNAAPINGETVGAIFYGETGSVMIGVDNAYTVYDIDGNVVKQVKSEVAVDGRNLMNPTETLDSYHYQNLFGAIREGEKLRSDIVSGHKSTLLVQLGNIAQRVGRTLDLDPQNGHILNDADGQKLWTREYEPGWEMKL